MSLLIVGMVAAATPAITLAEVRAMPPAAAGDRLLAEQPHGPIVAAREVPGGSLPTPGVVEVELDEKAAPRGGGCAFRRWKATFRHPQGASEAAAVMGGAAYPIWQVALAAPSGCGSASYAYVNPGIDPDRALQSLATVADLARRRPSSVAVTCRTEIVSGLCDNRGTLLRRVVAKGAWLVTDGGATVLYGVRWQVPVSVTVTGDPVTSVAISETIPPPF